MVGQPGQSDFGNSDWINKASPDQLLSQGKAVLSKIASMDQSTQRRFADDVRNDPAVSRLFEQIGTTA